MKIEYFLFWIIIIFIIKIKFFYNFLYFNISFKKRIIKNKFFFNNKKIKFF
jgi:hypothetical protein